MKISMNTLSKNFSRGLYQIDIPELGGPFRGKVRDNWVIQKGNSKIRVMVTTDRQSVYAVPVCTIPGKGQISNLISGYWFNLTKDIVKNHLIAIPHPNITIAKQAAAVLPVEIVLRRFLAKGSTTTSLYQNYFNLGRREIYGIRFPEGLKSNEELPMGTIITPTTKAVDGHDKELTDIEAKDIVDSKLGTGIWDKVKDSALKIFEFARKHSSKKGLILADTKFEFGIDDKGDIMLIDELLTPECSRFWAQETYLQRFRDNKDPEPNKNILVDWLKEHGFIGQGLVPMIDDKIINQQLEAYYIPYKMITSKGLTSSSPNSKEIRKEAIEYLKTL